MKQERVGVDERLARSMEAAVREFVGRKFGPQGVFRGGASASGWPNTQMPIYANVLGAALIGLSLTVMLVSRHPEQSRGIILSSVLTKALAGVTILYWVFIAGIELPSPWLLPAAVGVQVLFALGEAAYCLPSRTGGPNRRVA